MWLELREFFVIVSMDSCIHLWLQRHSELTVRERTCVLPLLICCTVLVVGEHLMKLLHNRAALELPEEILFSVISLPFFLVIFHKLYLLKWHKKPVSICLDTQAWQRHVWTCWSSCCSKRVMETKNHCRQTARSYKSFHGLIELGLYTGCLTCTCSALFG